MPLKIHYHIATRRTGTCCVGRIGRPQRRQNAATAGLSARQRSFAHRVADIASRVIFDEAGSERARRDSRSNRPIRRTMVTISHPPKSNAVIAITTRKTRMVTIHSIDLSQTHLRHERFAAEDTVLIARPDVFAALRA